MTSAFFGLWPDNFVSLAQQTDFCIITILLQGSRVINDPYFESDENNYERIKRKRRTGRRSPPAALWIPRLPVKLQEQARRAPAPTGLYAIIAIAFVVVAIGLVVWNSNVIQRGSAAVTVGGRDLFRRRGQLFLSCGL